MPRAIPLNNAELLAQLLAQPPRFIQMPDIRNVRVGHNPIPDELRAAPVRIVERGDVLDAQAMWNNNAELQNFAAEWAPVQPQFDKPAIFWGGSDVDPSLYNRPKSEMCGGTNAAADQREADQMQECINAGQPIIGICRGAQLLNVVNGGILVQHIDGHAIRGEHECHIQFGGEEIICGVSSTHHQMMVAHESGIIIGRADHTTGYHWDDVNTPYDFKYVTEVVYYPKTKSLCIQPHPEWMLQNSPFIKWINRFIKAEFGMEPLNFAEEEADYQGY